VDQKRDIPKGNWTSKKSMLSSTRGFRGLNPSQHVASVGMATSGRVDHLRIRFLELGLNRRERADASLLSNSQHGGFNHQGNLRVAKTRWLSTLGRMTSTTSLTRWKAPGSRLPVISSFLKTNRGQIHRTPFTRPAIAPNSSILLMYKGNIDRQSDPQVIRYMKMRNPTA
jgi:hypothetical protein